MNCGPRLGRLLASDGKCFDVAIDHGLFGERTFLGGIEDIGAAIRTIAAAGPDAIQLSVGTAPLLQNLPSPKPALVLRTDVANVYGSKLPSMLFSELVSDAVEHALRLDAACVVANLLMLPDEPDVHRQCLRNAARLKADCERFGMPLMIEPLVMRPNAERGGYMVDGDIENILPLVRQAVELGADVVKADPADDVSKYFEVVRVAGGVPVLVRGGGKVDDAEILKRTHELMLQGVKGIVYGRNVVQHPNPVRMVRALMAIVHSDAGPNDAIAILRG